MHVVGTYIGILHTGQPNQQAPHPKHFLTYLKEGLPKLSHIRHPASEDHVFTTYVNGCAKEQSFRSSDGTSQSEECRRLVIESHILGSQCSNMLHSFTDGEVSTPAWWRAEGKDGVTWLYSYHPVVSFRKNGDLAGIWHHAMADYGREKGLFDLPHVKAA